MTGNDGQPTYTKRLRQDLGHWVETDRAVALRLLDSIEAVPRDSSRGIGTSEPLNGLGSNTWSRGLTGEHRLVDRDYDDRVDFLQGRFHD